MDFEKMMKKFKKDSRYKQKEVKKFHKDNRDIKIEDEKERVNRIKREKSNR